jgi:hypothetical protein
MVSEFDELRQLIARETMQAVPAIVELTCSRLGIPVATGRARGGGAVKYPEPVTGLLIARELEDSAGQWARNYMRDLREDGASWQQIGTVIGWEDNAASRAFAAGIASPWLDSETGQWRDDGTFGWHCPECTRPIIDHSPDPGAENGHAEYCPRSQKMRPTGLHSIGAA